MKKYHKKSIRFAIGAVLFLLIAVHLLATGGDTLYMVMSFSIAASCAIFSYTSIKDQAYTDKYGDPEEAYQARKAKEREEAALLEAAEAEEKAE